MFDVPADTAYVWVGVSTVSVVALAVVLELPAATPPDAVDAARAIDAVAAGPTGSRATHSLRAERIRLGPSRIALDGRGGRTHAAFAYGPVTPVPTSGSLARVLEGARPSVAFDSPASFERGLEAARNHDPSWRPAPDRLTIRRVHWGNVRATLVG